MNASCAAVAPVRSTVFVRRMYEESWCSAPAYRVPSIGANGLPASNGYSAAPWLANCGNCAAGSTSLVGWKTPASSSGLSPSTTGPPSVPSKPEIGSAIPVTAVGSVLSVRVNAPR